MACRSSSGGSGTSMLLTGNRCRNERRAPLLQKRDCSFGRDAHCVQLFGLANDVIDDGLPLIVRRKWDFHVAEGLDRQLVDGGCPEGASLVLEQRRVENVKQIRVVLTPEHHHERAKRHSL